MVPGPLDDRSVVVCRAEEQSASLTRRLRAAGAEVLHLGLLPIEAPADDGASLRASLEHVDDFDWIALTSANAVAAIVAASTKWPPPVRLAAIGASTAAALEGHGAEADHVPSVSTAATLAAELPLDGVTRVLAPLAELAGDDLVEGLRARGFDVRRVEAYRLGEPPVLDPATLEAVSRADAVLFTSPSTVDRFLQQCPVWPSAVVSIGPSTSARLAGHHRAPTAEAERPGLDGLIDALVNTLNP